MFWAPAFKKIDPKDVRLWVDRQNDVNDPYNFASSLRVGLNAPHNLLVIAEVLRLSILTSIQPAFGSYSEAMEQKEWDLHSLALKAYIARLMAMRVLGKISAWQNDLAQLIDTLTLNRAEAIRVRAEMLAEVAAVVGPVVGPAVVATAANRFRF
jgi:hypothetical protein